MRANETILVQMNQIYLERTITAIGVIGKVEDKSMRSLKVAGLVLGTLLIAALPASARGGFRGGAVIVPSFGYYGGYSPYFYGPYGWYGPYEVYPMYSSIGELKLKRNIKEADVYINGAYAGKAEKLKTMWLRPDAYTVEIRAVGYAPYAQRIYLVPGKTSHVKVDLVPAAPRS